MSEYIIKVKDVLSIEEYKVIKEFGTSGHIVLPKKYIGKQCMVVIKQ